MRKLFFCFAKKAIIISFTIIFLVACDPSDGNTTKTTDQSTTQLPSDPQDALVSIGLDVEDAKCLIKNHPSDVQYVLENPDRIFKNLPKLADDMFVGSSDRGAAPFASFVSILPTWDKDQIRQFKKIFGRIVFVVNTQKFESAFNNNINLLNADYEGKLPYPENYEVFRDQANKAMLASNNHYKFYMGGGTDTTGLAYSMPAYPPRMPDLYVAIEPQILELVKGYEHNAASLILHELTHTWGYEHAGNAENTTLKANNIPYYVQFIIGTNAENPAAKVEPYTPKALLEVYFGHTLD
ncbi:hypothetical protein E2R68_02685 [Psychromonas sp. RZ22]|uniref:hypothetical protein n=1 Tax=Psychromonas algarum TaxID=2555643 RepID=UPI00106732B9|nr:hypothetical protein [Psychromonas sp. RZ22]TEW56017.1 hypothetical protein E2R68_02685 [Psychromonas sp. RZ22]